ncbi:hypothetical protein BJ508DRAFT_334215 [Ascobolus immersus RN42]|uniref:Uncharacterized protein n=1 Tax=Ascobolus immersus RN42 TaxID=1160509 RepID=A0A3N4HK93_ASCIM|nr:hypothetical protein BJ508DRAFT_334215 [Ascobolus immersus RN42]
MDRFFPLPDLHDEHTPSDFHLRPSPTHPFTHGSYFNTILQWTDSFLRLDATEGRPIEWLIPRILARAFLCRVSNAQIMPSQLLPEAVADRLLFVLVYTISMFRFFGVTEGPNDPPWMRAFIHTFELHEDDMPAVIRQLEARFERTPLLTLSETLANDDPNPGRLAILDAVIDDEPMVIDIDTIEPLNPIDERFAANDTDTLMYDGTGPTYIPAPLPPMPVARITSQSIEIGRNVAISMPGLQVWSYDTPPPQPPHQAIDNLERQMLLLQQTLANLEQRVKPQFSTSIPDTVMYDAPPESYQIRGALPRITLSPPREGVQQDLASVASTNPSLNKQLASLTLSSPQEQPPPIMSQPASPTPSITTPRATNPGTGSADMNPGGPSSTAPSTSAAAGMSSLEDELAAAAAGSITESTPIKSKPASEHGSHHSGTTDTEVKAESNHSRAATPADLETNRKIRAQQAKEFEEGKLKRLVEENARLAEKVARLEATAEERRIQQTIKAQHELREQHNARIAAAEAVILEADRLNNTQKTNQLRTSLANKRMATPAMPGAFDSDTTPVHTKTTAVPFDVDQTLDLLSKQAPEALDLLRQRLMSERHSPAPPTGRPVRHKLVSDDARFAPQGGQPDSRFAPQGGQSLPFDHRHYSRSAPQGGSEHGFVRQDSGFRRGSTYDGNGGPPPPRSGGRQPAAGAGDPGDDPSDDDSDVSDHRSVRSQPKKEKKRRELPGKPVHVHDHGYSATLPPRRQVTPAYLGRMPIHSVEPDFYEDQATCRAPRDFIPTFAYDDTLHRYNNKLFNDRWDSRRMPIYHESKTTLDSWLTKLHVEISINGQEAVCPLIGPKGLPEGTFLHRWYNNLNHVDLILLTIGPNPWYNWQYAICSLREHLNPLIRSQAESRTKLPDETYHAYLTTRYPLLKAAFPYEPETEIIRRLKTGFIDENAYTFMREQVDIRKLERESLEYEEMRTALLKNKPLAPPLPSSSYLRVSSQPETNQESSAQTFVAARQSFRGSKYQQRPAPAHNVYPVPADVVRDADLDPAIKQGRRNIPIEEWDPRARTVNMRQHPETKQMVRCYVRDNRQYVCIDRPCSKCQRQGLTPNDHFSFEHNLYHEEQGNHDRVSSHNISAGSDFVYQSSSSEDESGNEIEG